MIELLTLCLVRYLRVYKLAQLDLYSLANKNHLIMFLDLIPNDNVYILHMILLMLYMMQHNPYNLDHKKFLIYLIHTNSFYAVTIVIILQYNQKMCVYLFSQVPNQFLLLKIPYSVLLLLQKLLNHVTYIFVQTLIA